LTAFDSDAARSYHPRMPMWRCPHCGTPQSETARCWVCRRSSTACATCRHFRRSVAAQLGYCGLDAQRRPLRGVEIRACWEAPVAVAEAPPVVGRRTGLAPLNVVQDRTPVRRLEFIEVPSTQTRARRRAAPTSPTEPGADHGASPEREAPIAGNPAEPGWSLWGDLDG